MNALWDRNQGISRAVEPLLGTIWSTEAAGLAVRPDYCKRLLPPQADSDVGSGMLLRRILCAPYSTWEYSRIRPPSRSLCRNCRHVVSDNHDALRPTLVITAAHRARRLLAPRKVYFGRCQQRSRTR